jgi:hypothetical protein
VLRKSSTLSLDELGHASAGPSPKQEKESDIVVLIDMPGTATIVQSSIPEETHALSSAQVLRLKETFQVLN